ncbi:hypothetical protein [Haloimpatiens lingqiaonensis]|uniref:hypothetical protein n=1 Tax=Haloimpatiens lingqiaonensis TaxID=1380675 RepID=UPI0037C11DF7
MKKCTLVILLILTIIISGCNNKININNKDNNKNNIENSKISNSKKIKNKLNWIY